MCVKPAVRPLPHVDLRQYNIDTEEQMSSIHLWHAVSDSTHTPDISRAKLSWLAGIIENRGTMICLRYFLTGVSGGDFIGYALLRPFMAGSHQQRQSARSQQPKVRNRAEDGAGARCASVRFSDLQPFRSLCACTASGAAL